MIGQVRSECCSARLSWAQVPAFAGSSVQDRIAHDCHHFFKYSSIYVLSLKPAPVFLISVYIAVYIYFTSL